jgi:hypothetical protein
MFRNFYHALHGREECRVRGNLLAQVTSGGATASICTIARSLSFEAMVVGDGGATSLGITSDVGSCSSAEDANIGLKGLRQRLVDRRYASGSIGRIMDKATMELVARRAGLNK